jgi:hypothetical protein
MIPRIRTLALLAGTAFVGGPYVASETQFGRDTLRDLTANLPKTSRLVSSSYDSSDAYSGGINYDSYDPANEPELYDVDYANHSHHEVEKLRRDDVSRFRYDEDIARKLGALPANPQATPSFTGGMIPDLREVMRFDITPDWVIGRFSRVTTVLADTRLQGLRVPIVTGTAASDIAGTLTYYFDHKHTLQRLTVHGFTGDPGKIVGIMTGPYGLESNPALEAGVYTKRWNGVPVHFLRLTHAPVVYSDAVHQKYTVFLELNQPSLVYGISEEAQRIISSDRGSTRW